MSTINQVVADINALIAALVEVGLAGDQNFAFQRPSREGRREVTFPKSEYVSVALKNLGYSEIYALLAQERAYNAKMPDGAIVQMSYEFKGESLIRHRLAFFPSPSLEEFQNNPELYLEDELYADVVARNLVPLPVRFDYDDRDAVHQELTHPKSHLTLGQYENCRIPVTSPVPPSWFMDFILRNFYHTAFQRYCDDLPECGGVFERSIRPSEQDVVHVVIPS
jgi:hypothetical protein